jgi:hypothetical protein
MSYMRDVVLQRKIDQEERFKREVERDYHKRSLIVECSIELAGYKVGKAFLESDDHQQWQEECRY